MAEDTAQAGSNDLPPRRRLVLCKNCGGVCGNPYARLEIKKDVLFLAPHWAQALSLLLTSKQVIIESGGLTSS